VNLKKVTRRGFALVVIVILMAISLVAPINRSNLHDQPFYSNMLAMLDTMKPIRSAQSKILASWTKVNVTPSYEMPMAGYKPRKSFESVHDSLFARILFLQSGSSRIAIVNIDLLIFPPVLKNEIQRKLRESGAEIFLYLSATHTHNGIGGWDDSTLGRVASGEFHEEWIDSTANKIVNVITASKPIEASVSYWESDASELVVNRIAYGKGKTDGKLRGLQLKRVDSTKALVFSFSAHPTSVTKKSLSLSVDYPGSTLKLIEQDFDFGMFMGGMVGSHSFNRLEEQNFELVEKEGQLIYQKISARTNFTPKDSISISYAHIPIQFGPSQLRIADNWKVRNWVLGSLFGGLKGELTYLRIGDIIMIGTPCDFSGEIFAREGLENYVESQNKHLMVTSFNGDYIGYITHDGHYDSIKNAETRELNWVGPYYGEYFSTMIKKLIDKESAIF
jgi:hypothetical protein